MTEYEMAERPSGNYLRKRKVTLVDFSGSAMSAKANGRPIANLAAGCRGDIGCAQMVAKKK